MAEPQSLDGRPISSPSAPLEPSIVDNSLSTPSSVVVQNFYQGTNLQPGGVEGGEIPGQAVSLVGAMPVAITLLSVCATLFLLGCLGYMVRHFVQGFWRRVVRPEREEAGAIPIADPERPALEVEAPLIHEAVVLSEPRPEEVEWAPQAVRSESPEVSEETLYSSLSSSGTVVPAVLPADVEVFTTPGVVRRGHPESLREATHRALRESGQTVEDGWRSLPTSYPASVSGGRLQSLSSGEENGEDTD